MWSRKLKTVVLSLIAWVLFCTTPAHSSEEGQWLSITLDNDIFLGDDSGYTNGLFVSGFSAFEGDYRRDRHFLLWPLIWTMPTSVLLEHQAEAFTLGQALSTPNDISLLDPPLDEPPYGALLYFAKSYVQVTDNYADQITTTVGVVGPAALGEPAQTLVHKVTGSAPPRGWDTQIGNEVVFSFARGRLWRNWSSRNGHADFLSTVSAELGTIQTSFNSSVYLRYGRNLKRSFATPLLSGSRASNPIAIDNGWYVYAGLSLGARLRMILLDGNHFKKSRSVDYRREYLGLTVGATYAWSGSSLTFAVSDSSVLQELNDEKLDQVTQFGSLTFAWQLDPESSRKRGWLFESPEDQDDRRR